MIQLHLPLALLLIPAAAPAAQNPARHVKQPNIVLLIADDMGVDLTAAYGEAPNTPCTPVLDELAAGGLLFRNAWTNPTCSPTRAAILTGRHGFRTGIGFPVTNMGMGLGDSESTLPELLTRYESTAVGKWHLRGTGQTTMHPNDSGFDRYAGSLSGQVPDYFAWVKTIDGQTNPVTTYATTDTANEAIAAITTMSEPWFLYASFNAPHSPFHIPPTTLCGCGVPSFCDSLPAGPAARARAMVEALDTEMGRVIDAVRAVAPDSLIVFIGDNGTPGNISEAPFLASHAKGTMYEGGVNVPLIFNGPMVRPGECAALVSSVDLYATFAELAGVTSTAEDSVSMVPYFHGGVASIRETVYSETFQPNGFGPYTDHRRAVRNERYKLIRSLGAADELYDLSVDDFETSDLFPALTPQSPAWSDYQALVAELAALGVD